MPHWIYWAIGLFVVDGLLLVWNHGAHRKENPREFRSEYWQ